MVVVGVIVGEMEEEIWEEIKHFFQIIADDTVRILYSYYHLN